MTDRYIAPGAAVDDQSSTRQRRRPRTPAHSRETILRAATVEFAAHGFAGARIGRIVKKAETNPRMIYHYFGSKSQLYIAVLEKAFEDLRREELSIEVAEVDPLEGVLQLFDFMNTHFERNQDLVSLLRGENMLRARYMRKSSRIRDLSLPLLAMIERLLARGAALGHFPEGLDGLRLYVLMVALAQFHLANAHTLSMIFDHDLTDASWRRERAADARRMLAGFLRGSGN